MVFKYSGIDSSGKKVSGKVEAHDLEDAKRKLKATKIIYSSLKKHEGFNIGSLRLSTKKLSAKELSNLSRDLAIYIRSGISIVGAVRLAKTQYDTNKKINNFLTAISSFLDEGKTFYQALENQTLVDLPAFYKQSIRVSEDGGILDKVLLEMSKFLKEQDRVNKQIQSSFAYPAFIITVAIFMVGFMLSFVVPKISAMFKQMNQELPAMTKFVIALGDFVTNYWLAVVILFTLFLAAFSWMKTNSKEFKLRFDGFLLRVPLFGKIIETSELARFAYITSVLLRSGVPFVQAINLSAKILKNSVLSAEFENASTKVVEGGKLSVALARGSYPIDKAFVQAITLGEETSEVVQVLENLADLYLENNKDKIGVLLSLMEPAMMLVVGGIIGFIITAMLLPIFSMNLQ